MRAVAYAAGYVLDFFRERVTGADFEGEHIGRVIRAPGFDEAGEEAIRRLFPRAELRTFDRQTSLWALRTLRPDVICIPMAGGDVKSRLVAMLAGARHELLIPSPDYIYRFGMRRGLPRLCWAVVDRFLFAPFALMWLMVVCMAMYASGLVSRSLAAERDAPWRPKRVLVIRLMPTNTFVSLLRRIRRRLPDVWLTALLASEEGRPEVAAVADEVLTPARGVLSLSKRLRASRFDTSILAGGADYGFSPAYVKAVLLSSFARADARCQWELGVPLPGLTLREAAARARDQARQRDRGSACILGRWRLRRRYAREPARGPEMVQIGITKACNYHCLFCPFHNPQVDRQHREADQPRMTFEMYARLLGELKRMGTRAIDICGDGEPLTHPEAFEMIELAREMGFEVTLATNAVLLDEGRARRLVDLGVRRMHVSFNAATDDVYERLHPGAPPSARARIIERLRAMAAYAESEGLRPIEVEFSAVLNRLNMHHLPQMVDAAHEAGAGWFMLILMGPAEGAEELLPRLEDWILISSDIARAAGRARAHRIRTNLDAIRPGASAAGTGSVYERVPCYIGHEYALITADGSVLFCCQCTQRLGNLHRDSFQRIWYSETYRQARVQARCLPRQREPLPGCECFTACSHVVVNLEVYRKLYGERAAR
jgi:MoaA/NifB/PqqE/SkfB family radical SAM enzyme